MASLLCVYDGQQKAFVCHLWLFCIVSDASTDTTLTTRSHWPDATNQVQSLLQQRNYFASSLTRRTPGRSISGTGNNTTNRNFGDFAQERKNYRPKPMHAEKSMGHVLRVEQIELTD
jgi:hypothetical protein